MDWFKDPWFRGANAKVKLLVPRKLYFADKK